MISNKPILTTEQIMEIMIGDKNLHDMPIAVITTVFQ